MITFDTPNMPSMSLSIHSEPSQVYSTASTEQYGAVTSASFGQVTMESRTAFNYSVTIDAVDPYNSPMLTLPSFRQLGGLPMEQLEALRDMIVRTISRLDPDRNPNLADGVQAPDRLTKPKRRVDHVDVGVVAGERRAPRAYRVRGWSTGRKYCQRWGSNRLDVRSAHRLQ